MTNVNISLCITFSDCPGYGGKFLIPSCMASLCCKITPIKLELDKGRTFVLHNVVLTVTQYNVYYSIHLATASAWGPLYKHLSGVLMEKPERLIQNVSLRTRCGMCGGRTGHVTSCGEPDVGSGPDRKCGEDGWTWRRRRWATQEWPVAVLGE